MKEKNVLLVALVILLGTVVGCSLQQEPGPQRHIFPAVPYTRTAEHPIMPDVGQRDSYAVFGGKDGKSEIRITWPEGLACTAISLGGQCAAALAKPKDDQNAHVVFYDVEGKEINRVALPWTSTSARGRSRQYVMWLGDRQEAVVHASETSMGRSIAQKQQAKSLGTYYANAQGIVRDLKTPWPTRTYFPRFPGFYVATFLKPPRQEEHQATYELRRYDAEISLLWKKEYAHGLTLGRPQCGGDVWIQSGREDGMDLKQDGTQFIPE